MKQSNSLLSYRLAASLALVGAFLSTTTTSRANVYASDIQIGGTLSSTNAVPVGENGQTTISYRLNQAATLGCTISILDANSNLITTIVGRTSMGLNSVIWGTTNSAGQPVPQGTYSVSITAAATGFNVWTQISVDSNPGMPANYPEGIAVDKNPFSPYYGRVVFDCASTGPNANTPATAKQIGFFKCNADGSQADEGWFGYAGYTTNDAGYLATNEMSNGTNVETAAGVNPLKVRIGDDDRIYWVDDSYRGAIVACDMQATTNQIVINEGPNSPGYPNCPYNYSLNPDYSDLTAVGGIGEFDVVTQSPTGFTPGVLGGSYYGAVFLCDGDYPNWGIWMYHMVNGASDPNDTTGDQVVYAGSGSSLTLVSSGGCMVDTNLDIFVGQNRNNAGDDDNRAMVFSNWNAGVLPAEGQGFGPALLTAGWAVGASDNSFEQGRDVALNSRKNPTIVAIPMMNGANYVSGASGAGIRLLNAIDGSVVTVTNGATVITYTNLDVGEIYTSAAWDNVGNLYAASTQRNLWRAWSPPGASSNTTVATETMAVQPLRPTALLATSAFSGEGGTNATPITAAYTGTAPLTLQWYSIDVNNNTNAVIGQVSNAAVSSTLELSNLTASENGNQYFLIVSNALGAATTTVATLTVYTTPQILTNISPLSQVASVGSPVTFSVTAVGTVPLSYQWYENGSLIAGQTNSTYLFTATLGTNTYYVNVANSVVPSGVNSATVTVIGNRTGLPVYEPFTEYASQVTANSSNAVDLCTSGLTVPSADGVSMLTWTSFNYNGLATASGQPAGWDVLVTQDGTFFTADSIVFPATTVDPLLPTGFPGRPASGGSIQNFAVNPSQTLVANVNPTVVGNSAVLEFASDFGRPASGARTLYISYLVSFAQKGQLGTGNDGRYLALFSSTNLSEPSTVYPYWSTLFNVFGGSPRYAAHGLLDVSTTSSYIGPCDCSAGKDFSTSIFQAPLGNNAPATPVFVVGAYTLNATGQDVNSMWVNPSLSSFGGATPPGTAQNDVMPAGYNMNDLSALCLIDRVGSGGLGGVGTNYIANLIIGTTWSYVTGGPEFTAQPMSLVANNNSATLTASAVAAGQTVGYQWQRLTATTTNNVSNGAGGAGGSATVSGATNSTLTLTGMSSADAGTYQVVASASGTGYVLASSQAAVTGTFTTQPPPSPVEFATVPVTGGPAAPVLHFSGAAGGAYHVWSTTNIALTPVESTWTLIGTGTFSGGADSFAAPTNGPATKFYTITQP